MLDRFTIVTEVTFFRIKGDGLLKATSELKRDTCARIIRRP